jgi:CRISPR-associated RAMP protein (TIGR02581 family)
MFGQTLNELTFTLTLTPRGPLLIKAGEDAVAAREVEDAMGRLPREQMAYFMDRKQREEERRAALKKQTRDNRAVEREAQRAARQQHRPPSVVETAEPADMRFVLTQRGGRAEPYIPGSSLKGVLRSQAERLARSMTTAGDGACNPFGTLNGSDAPCWHALGDPHALHQRPALAVEAYPVLCPVCKLFGSPYLASRLRIGDAYLIALPAGELRLPRRDGVGIDRRRGAAADGAKYDFELWDGGAFQAQVNVRNFELWQLGLLAHVLHALNAEEISVGFGARRGLGRVRGTVGEMTLAYVGAAALAQVGPELPLLGLGQLAQDYEPLADYGFLPGEAPVLAQGARLLTGDGPSLRRTWAIAEPERLWETVGPLWTPVQVAELSARYQVAADALLARRRAAEGEVDHG